MNSNLKIASYEYAIVRLAIWAIEDSNQRFLDLNDFSFSNSFSRNRILLYPFFLATANGNREQMFRLFDNFTAQEFGHCEKDVFNAVSNGLTKLFKSHSKSLVFEDSFLSYYQMENPDTSKLSNWIGQLYDLNDLDLTQLRDYTTIEIEHSIDVLRERNDGDFIRYDELTLQSYSTYHNSWQIVKSLGENASLPSLKQLINRLLIAEPSMFNQSSITF